MYLLNTLHHSYRSLSSPLHITSSLWIVLVCTYLSGPPSYYPLILLD